jgi:hypothetical protein
MSDPIILLFIAVGSICFGFLLGFLMRGITRRRDASKEAAEPEQINTEVTAPPREAPAKKKAPNRNWVEVAKLWQDRKKEQLIFQIEDQYYKRSSDLSTKERKILLKVVMDFYHWLEPPRAVASKPQESVSAVQLVDTVPIAATPTGENGNNGTKPVSLNPINMLSRAFEADVAKSALPNQSMVTQVDAILQEKLQEADMQKWAVRLTEFPGKGMMVMVGLEQYEGIDEVPYERVRTIIRSSVAEWERRAEAGKLAQ